MFCGGHFEFYLARPGFGGTTGNMSAVRRLREARTREFGGFGPAEKIKKFSDYSISTEIYLQR